MLFLVDNFITSINRLLSEYKIVFIFIFSFFFLHVIIIIAPNLLTCCGCGYKNVVCRFQLPTVVQRTYKTHFWFGVKRIGGSKKNTHTHKKCRILVLCRDFYGCTPLSVDEPLPKINPGRFFTRLANNARSRMCFFFLQFAYRKNNYRR